MFLKKTQKLAEMRIKQSIIEDQIHGTWEKPSVEIESDRKEVSETLDSPKDSEKADNSK